MVRNFARKKDKFRGKFSLKQPNSKEKLQVSSPKEKENGRKKYFERKVWFERDFKYECSDRVRIRPFSKYGSVSRSDQTSAILYIIKLCLNIEWGLVTGMEMERAKKCWKVYLGLDNWATSLG